MINRVSIRDFAIIRELELPLKPGLTIITGETGAGKSVLVKALAVTLGAKALKTDVRSSGERAVVEAEVLRDNKTQTLRRVVTKGGRTRSFIQDEPCLESEFKSRVAPLADFHGQHEQQYIMDPATHIDFLDSFCSHESKVNEIQAYYERLTEGQKELETLKVRKTEAASRRELVNFQIQEIEGVNPQIGEDESLGKEFKTLNHMDELVDTVGRLNQALTEQDHSVYAQLASAVNKLEALAAFDESLTPFVDSIREASVSVQDVSVGLIQHVDALDHDQSKLQDIEERLHAIDGLKRKYGGSIESVLDYREAILEELTVLSNLDGEIAKVEEDIKVNTTRYQELADHLNGERTLKGKDLEKAIEKEMAELNMPGARFEVQLDAKSDKLSQVVKDGKSVMIGPKGYDRVAFFLSANPGEAPKPLHTVASGGEVSRIMLAIKTILKENDPVDTLIFDEIDAGISGQAAEKVAESLVELAGNKQVICITHLPQIASRADHHLYIRKIQNAGSTSVEVTYLDAEGKVQAIAELFSGMAVTGESLTTARHFLEQARG